MASFKIYSYNVNGLGNFRKRKKCFYRMKALKADIVLLQETHSTQKSENLWKTQWGGQIVFSHGESNAKGVAILIRRNLEIKVVQNIHDGQGRVLAIKIKTQNQEIIIANFYAPNNDNPQFFIDAFAMVESLGKTPAIIAGDFNTVLNQDADLRGGASNSHIKCTRLINEYMGSSDLVDIWRIKNPDVFRSTLVRHKPYHLMERIDFFLLSSMLIQSVEDTQIIPSYLSDHSIPFLQINTGFPPPGKSYWKMNVSLLDDDIVIQQVTEKIKEIMYSYTKEKICTAWEVMKIAIKEIIIVRAVQISKSRKAKLSALEKKLGHLIAERDKGELAVNELFTDHSQQIQKIKSDINDIYQHIASGIIMRSKAVWYELGEKPTSYFLSLEKYNHNKRVIHAIRDPSSGDIIYNEKQILETLSLYFENLYKDKQLELDPDYLALLNVPQISDKHKQMLDASIQLEEIRIALKQMNMNKCPGADGIPVEFYMRFWGLLARPMQYLFLQNVKNSKLHTSARDIIFSLMDKPRKDLLEIDNWRPLSMLTTDYKIYAKVLANRLQSVLPSIISDDQKGYMKGRNLSDNILDLLSIIQYCDINQIPALVTAVDYKKAFDSVQHESLEKILEAFGIGQGFIQMVMLCYREMRGMVINNGKWERSFPVQAGIKQGCPLSGMLILLVLEIQNLKIKQNQEIESISMQGQDKMSGQYVDDLWNVIIASQSSFDELIYEYTEFELYTGLSINYNKTEILRIGSLKNSNAKFYSTLPIKWSDTSIKILGLDIYSDYQTTIQANYDNLLDKIDNILNSWSIRTLTPIGKIQVINSLINSQCIYRLQCLPTPSKEFFAKYKSIITKFIWNKKVSKIAYRRLIASFKQGGLQLRDLKLVDMSLKLAKVHSVLHGKVRHFWHNAFLSIFCMAPAHVFQANFKYEDACKLLKPSIFVDMCKYWAQFNYNDPNTIRDIFAQPLWYNSHIKSNKVWLYNDSMYQNKVYKVVDLFDLDTGEFMSYHQFCGWFPEVKVNYIEYYRIIKAIPKKWKRMLLENRPDPPAGDEQTWTQAFCDTKKKPSRFAYNYVRDKIFIDNEKLRINWQTKLKVTISKKRFGSVFVKVRKTTISTKLRYFQYRILCNVLTVNNTLAKWNHETDDHCTFCHTPGETVEHIFYSCPKVNKLWIALQKWLKYFSHVEFKIFKSRIILNDYTDKDASLKNIICLITKFYIYRARCQKSPLVFTDLIKEINEQKKIEFNIASKNDKLYRHAKKWADFSIFN